MRHVTLLDVLGELFLRNLSSQGLSRRRGPLLLLHERKKQEQKRADGKRLSEEVSKRGSFSDRVYYTPTTDQPRGVAGDGVVLVVVAE